MIGAPLIVTAELPPDIFSRAQQLRLTHFPPERNFLKAHVTLFHALPPGCEGELRQCLARLASDCAPPPARLEGVLKLGRGTALKLSSPALIEMRDWLAERFFGLLTPQDQQRPRLHITVQNKVRTEEARALQDLLQLQIVPADFAFRGLELSAYRGGPWEHLGRWRFRG